MKHMKSMLGFASWWVPLLIYFFVSPHLWADSIFPTPFEVGLEVGPGWQSRNDVRIPGDEGTKFSMTDLTGSGPKLAGRVWLDWNTHSPHQYRFAVVPFRVQGTGKLTENTNFNGQTFLGGVPTEGTYQFDTYRFTYRYMFHNKEKWTWNIGGTLLIRDAEIKLEQAGVSSSKTNVGFAPLLHVFGQRRITNRLRAQMEFDGLAGGPGRAFDFALQGIYALSQKWDIGLGFRTIEGGSDTDEVYSFGWFNFLNLIAIYRF
jgi:hypothetical protein